MSATRVISVLLYVIAGVLAIVVVLSLLTGGLQVALGPIRFSAAHPARVALQAALAWLVAILLADLRPKSWRVMLAIVAVVLAACLESSARRVGDGAEYMAMAMNLSAGRPPALSPRDLVTVGSRMARVPGFESADLDRSLVGADGRQDYHHFWLYSALVAPLMAIARALSLHPNDAFTAFNALLIAGLVWCLVRQDRAVAACLVAAGPLLWWVDKAHAEVFLVVTMAFAVLEVERRPALALIAAALATAQNPAAGVAFAAVAAYVLLNVSRSRAVLAATAAGVALAALPAAYYMWHLGTWSPLATTIGRGMPGLRALLTPVLDPNLGLVPNAPVLAAIAVFGFLRLSRWRASMVIITAGALAFVFAQSSNVNHGGSPGMSRYALWLLAIMLPLLAEGAEWLRTRRPGLLAAAVIVSVAMSWFAFRPVLADRGGDGPTILASALWSRWPGLDNPLPEVFAERVSGIDGLPPVPVATPGCEKVLVRGDGTQAFWPFPCEPAAAPARCTAAGALCYVNGGTFTAAPRQPLFMFDPVPERSWSLQQRGRLPELLNRLGGAVRAIRLSDGSRRVHAIDPPAPYEAVEGASGTAIWLRTNGERRPALRISTAASSLVEVRDAVSNELLLRLDLPAGDRAVKLPALHAAFVLVTDAAERRPRPIVSRLPATALVAARRVARLAIRVY